MPARLVINSIVLDGGCRWAFRRLSQRISPNTIDDRAFGIVHRGALTVGSVGRTRAGGAIIDRLRTCAECEYGGKNGDQEPSGHRSLHLSECEPLYAFRLKDESGL